MDSLTDEEQQTQLRNVPGKIRKALVAAIASYNTMHRAFTKKADRGKDIQAALVELSKYRPEVLGNVGVFGIGVATGNYLGSIVASSGTKDVPLSLGGRLKKSRPTRKKRR